MLIGDLPPVLRNLLLLALAMAVISADLMSGSSGLRASEVFAALTGGGDPLSRDIVLDLRLPRTLVAFACGGLLALAGTLLQALLRNPLADPFVLGVSSGAGAATLVAMLLGASTLVTALGGLAGALLSLALLFALAWRGGLLPARLLLAGVMLSATWGALVTLILSLAPDAPLRSMLYWLMGDLAAATTEQGIVMSLLMSLGLLLAMPLASALDALQRGELTAAALGVRLGAVRVTGLLIAAAATATVVLLAGSIGFVGLVVPHLLRISGVRGHAQLMPASVLAGGSLLVMADVLARTIVAPIQLPVGALTAILGAPLFLWLLTRTSLGR